MLLLIGATCVNFESPTVIKTSKMKKLLNNEFLIYTYLNRMHRLSRNIFQSLEYRPKSTFNIHDERKFMSMFKTL